MAVISLWFHLNIIEISPLTVILLQWWCTGPCRTSAFVLWWPTKMTASPTLYVVFGSFLHWITYKVFSTLRWFACALQKACFQLALASDYRTYRSYSIYNYNNMGWKVEMKRPQSQGLQSEPYGLFNSQQLSNRFYTAGSSFAYQLPNLRGPLGNWLLHLSHSLVHSPIQSFIRLIFHWFIRSVSKPVICSVIHSVTYSFTCPVSHLASHLPIDSITHSHIYSFNWSFSHSIISVVISHSTGHSFGHLLIHLVSQQVIYSFIHSFIYSLV